MGQKLHSSKNPWFSYSEKSENSYYVYLSSQLIYKERKNEKKEKRYLFRMVKRKKEEKNRKTKMKWVHLCFFML